VTEVTFGLAVALLRVDVALSVCLSLSDVSRQFSGALTIRDRCSLAGLVGIAISRHEPEIGSFDCAPTPRLSRLKNMPDHHRVIFSRPGRAVGPVCVCVCPNNSFLDNFKADCVLKTLFLPRLAAIKLAAFENYVTA